MRIVMPLFNFELKGAASYVLGDSGLSIVPFDKADILDSDLFSKLDLDNMRENADWALVYEGPDGEGYIPKINILMLAFKIFSANNYPCIKYRLRNENPVECVKLLETMTYNWDNLRNSQPFTSADLDCIKDGFSSLVEMDQVSDRTHNALYFLYRGWHNIKWMDSFILTMCSLESLFSKDEPGGAAAAIENGVSTLLGSKPKCTKEDIANLYDVRSRMIHGNIRASDNPGENLAKLNHLEYVTIECFKTIVEGKRYLEYKDKSSRDRLMESYWKPKKGNKSAS